jgi:hydrogenase maturation protease
VRVRTLVLGVGNTILTDDAVGIRVIERARELAGPCPGVDFDTTERGGLDLVDLAAGYERLVTVDGIVASAAKPGTIITCDLDADFRPSQHLNAAHGVDLPTALAMGRALGATMPSTVTVVAVVVADPYTVSEELTPDVAQAVEEAARTVLRIACAAEGR